MRGHHAGQLAPEPVAVRGDVLGPDRIELAFIDRDLDVRVGFGIAVTRKMLADATHARLRHAGHERLRERRDDERVAVESPVADDAAATVVEVEHRRETQIDAVREQLGGEHVARAARGFERCDMVALPEAPQAAHRRNAREAIGTKTLHPTAFMIDRDDQRRAAQRMDLGGQRQQLFRVAEVAREQDHAADQRVEQPLALFIRERKACDIEHHRPQRPDGGGRTGLESHRFSIRAKATT